MNQDGKDNIIDNINYRITEWLRLEGTSEDHVIHLLCQSQSPRAHCTAWHPDGF